MNRRRQFVVIYLIVFLDLLGFGLIVPQLGIYAKLYGATGAMQGLLIASYSMMQFVFAPLMGRWSDRRGRRPVLILSLCGSLAGYLMFGLARNLPLLFASRVVHGFGSSNISTAQAYLTDITDRKHRARAMGMIGAAFGLGFVLGPAIGAVAGHYGMEAWGQYGGSVAIGAIAAVLSSCTLLLAIFYLPESRETPTAPPAEADDSGIHAGVLRYSLAHPVLRRLLLIFFVNTAGFAVLHAILTYFLIDALKLQDHSHIEAVTGEVFCWVGVLTVLIQGGGVGPLVKRHGEESVLSAGMALMAVGLALMPRSHSLGGVLLTTFPLGIGYALCAATLPAVLTFHTPDDHRGAVLGVSQSMGSLGRIFGPLAGGLLYDYGHGYPFYVGAALCLTAFAVSLGVRHDPRQETAEAVEDAA